MVFFGEKVDYSYNTKAIAEANQADFCLVIGSSMQVNPAAKIPKILLEKSHPVAVINLQRTNIDEKVLRIGMISDTVFERVAE